MSAGSVRSSLPLGPSTTTCPGSRVTFTDAGQRGSAAFQSATTLSSISYQTYARTSPPRPWRCAWRPLMTPSAVLRMAIPRPTEDPRDLGLARVDAQPGAADPLQPGDHALAIRAGLEDDTHRLGRPVGLDLVAGDVALVLEDAGDLELQLGRGHLHLGMPGAVRVADARQHVRDRIAHDARRSPLEAGFALTSGGHHQLDFVTPGMRPSAARFAEADAAHAELAKESARAPAKATPVVETDLVLRVHKVPLPALER